MGGEFAFSSRSGPAAADLRWQFRIYAGWCPISTTKWGESGKSRGGRGFRWLLRRELATSSETACGMFVIRTTLERSRSANVISADATFTSCQRIRESEGYSLSSVSKRRAKRVATLRDIPGCHCWLVRQRACRLFHVTTLGNCDDRNQRP